jgi:hypothetical protein
LAESERRYQDSERRYHDAERRADRAELMGVLHNRDTTSSPNFPASSRHSSRPSYRQDIFYSDGGRATRWYGGDLSDDGDDIYGFNDSPGTRRITVPDRSPSPLTPTVPENSSSRSSSSAYTPPLPPRMRDRTYNKDVNEGEKDNISQD